MKDIESLMRSRFITTTTVFTLRSKAIRRHKSAVNRIPDAPIWKVTAGNRIAVDLSSCRWLLNCEFETHTVLAGGTELEQAAIRLAELIQYRNAGTVEFLYHEPSKTMFKDIKLPASFARARASKATSRAVFWRINC